jgi:hypothetical protein
MVQNLGLLIIVRYDEASKIEKRGLASVDNFLYSMFSSSSIITLLWNGKLKMWPATAVGKLVEHSSYDPIVISLS